MHSDRENFTNKEKGKPKRLSAPPSPTGPDTDTTVLVEILIAGEVTLHNRFAPLEIEDVPPYHANPEAQSTSLLSTTIPAKPRFVNPQVKYIWKSTHKTTPDEVCAHISGLGFSINDFIVERRNSRRGHKKVWYFALLAEASTIRSIGSKWHSLNQHWLLRDPAIHQRKTTVIVSGANVLCSEVTSLVQDYSSTINSPEDAISGMNTDTTSHPPSNHLLLQNPQPLRLSHPISHPLPISFPPLLSESQHFVSVPPR